MLIEDAKTADRSEAETTAECLTTLSRGVIEGDTAEAVLLLLRDGTEIKKAFVMRGLQLAKSFAPAVEARLVEIVRSVEPQDYDSHYFFYFLASRWAPKSDAVVDVMLDTAGTGKGQIDAIVRGFATGLTDAQRDRAASKLLDFVENAGSPYARQALLETLAKIAGASHVARLEAIAANPNADADTKKLAATAAKAAGSRR